MGPLLILGASGFLGAHILREARVARSRTIGAARHPERLPSFARGPGDLPIRWDATEHGATERLFEELRPAAVVNVAALSRIAQCETDPGLARELNVELPGQLATLCQEREVRFLHVSTDLVFGGAAPAGDRFEESDEPAPLSEYGRTKAAGERAVLEACPGALVVRLPLLYGDSGGRGLGASDSILAMLARGETPRLFVDEWRTPLEAGNAAAALLEALGAPLSGLLHVAGPRRLDRHALGLVLLEKHGYSEREARSLLRAGQRSDLAGGETRPADIALDASRARAVLETPLAAP